MHREGSWFPPGRGARTPCRPSRRPSASGQSTRPLRWGARRRPSRFEGPAPSADWSRRGRRRDPSPRNIHVAAAAPPRPVVPSQPIRLSDRRRDPSPRNIRVAAAAPPRPVVPSQPIQLTRRASDYPAREAAASPRRRRSRARSRSRDGAPTTSLATAARDATDRRVAKRHPRALSSPSFGGQPLDAGRRTAVLREQDSPFSFLGRHRHGGCLFFIYVRRAFFSPQLASKWSVFIGQFSPVGLTRSCPGTEPRGTYRTCDEVRVFAKDSKTRPM